MRNGLVIAVLTASFLVLPGEAWADMGERAVAKCVLENMEGVNDRSAAALVHAACDTLYGTHQCKIDLSGFSLEELDQIEAAEDAKDYSTLSKDMLDRLEHANNRAKDPKCRVPNS